jgi:RimJ/RimL family protein N-acetyltransferase
MPFTDRLSLGWRSELIFPRFDAQVIERPDYLLIRTPQNPTFWWGNFLLFDRAPRAGDAATWTAAFEREIVQHQSESRHLAFGVDAAGPIEVPADFAALGLTAMQGAVLTLAPQQLKPPRKAIGDGWRIRPLRLPDEGALAAKLQVAADIDGHEPGGYLVFRERQMLRYGSFERAGLGHWFGVFAPPGADGNDTGEALLVADCGLFRDGFGPGAIGRFQFVSTHPAWRRRGLCSALIHAVCRHGFEVMGLSSLVIIADPGYVAIGLYEALGFQRAADTWGMERRPPRENP